MKIGIDVRSMNAAGTGRGLVTYTRNLVSQLTSIDQNNRYCLFIDKTQDVTAFLQTLSVTDHIKIVRLTRPTRLIVLWDQLCWYHVLKRERIDVFHSLIYGIPLLCPCHRILTIHDLTPFVFPEVVSKFRQKIVFRINFSSGKFADRIITASQHSKQDLLQHLHLAEKHIAVISDGVSERYTVLGHDDVLLRQINARYHIPGRFLLYVGGFDRNKNLITLLQAFRRLLENHPSLKDTVYLVFTGTLTPAADTLRALSREWGLGRSVIFTGFAPEEDLIRLYNAAEVFVFPSLYEGFGLPPLEAMACGTPVICSNAASLPEVVGDAAMQVSPDSPAELASAIYDVLSNPQLQERMRRKGLERAKEFSWNNTAGKTLQVYAEVFRKQKPSSS